MAANQDVVVDEAVGHEKQPGVVNDKREVAYESGVQTSGGAIILIPQPSSDPRDPLVGRQRETLN